MIGELDDLLGTTDANKCILLDPMFPVLLPYIDGMQCKHNVAELIGMTDDFLNSSTSQLY